MKIQLGFSEVRALNCVTLILLKSSTPFAQTVRWESSQHHTSHQSTNQRRAGRASPEIQNPLPPTGSSLLGSLALQRGLEYRRGDSYQLVTHHGVLSLTASDITSLSQQHLETGGLRSNILTKSSQDGVGLACSPHRCEIQRPDPPPCRRYQPPRLMGTTAQQRSVGQREHFEFGWTTSSEVGLPGGSSAFQLFTESPQLSMMKKSSCHCLWQSTMKLTADVFLGKIATLSDTAHIHTHPFVPKPTPCRPMTTSNTQDWFTSF